MVYAIPAGLALAACGWLTSWAAARFDAGTPPAWTRRPHAREIVSAVVLAAWVGACLLAGEAFLLFERGLETPEQFLIGAAIAASGALPALLAFLRRRGAGLPV